MLLTHGRSFVNSSVELLNKMSVFVSFNCSEIRQSVPSKHIKLFQHQQYFIWDFGELPFREHLGKCLIKIGKISAKIHEIGKIKAIFALGMTPL